MCVHGLPKIIFCFLKTVRLQLKHLIRYWATPQSSKSLLFYCNVQVFHYYLLFTGAIGGSFDNQPSLLDAWTNLKNAVYGKGIAVDVSLTGSFATMVNSDTPQVRKDTELSRLSQDLIQPCRPSPLQSPRCPERNTCLMLTKCLQRLLAQKTKI